MIVILPYVMYVNVLLIVTVYCSSLPPYLTWWTLLCMTVVAYIQLFLLLLLIVKSGTVTRLIKK